MKIRELQAERSNLLDEVEGILKLAEREGRGLNPAEDRRYKQLLEKINELDDAIKQAEQRSNATLAALNAGVPLGNLYRVNESELSGYSLTRLIRAAVDAREGRPGAYKQAELEVETSKLIARSLGREPRGFFVPAAALEKRDLVKGTASAGGYLVGTDTLGSNLIGLLRNQASVIRAGATVLGNLVGDVDIPKQTGSATAYWVAEGASLTESQPSFDRVRLSPKSVGAYVDISRKMLLQSSTDVEAFVRQDLASVLSLAIDYAALHGTGTNNQPTGIANTTGVNIVEGGTNGAAPTWEHIVKLETEVSVSNANTGTLAYMTNAKVRGKLKTTPKVTGQSDFVWGDTADRLNGYPAYVTNQVLSDLTKGTANNCSAIFFGNWSDLIIGMWGVLDILVDPYTLGTSGGVRIIAFQDVDIAVRHPESFAVMLDALA